ncbi:MAG TPA: type II secretion system protein [Pyrinomonadaceae bacterium]|nr:type II secretion system protein [Pyrinomonadaceae bacterium]
MNRQLKTLFMPKLGKAEFCSLSRQQRGFSVAELLVVLSIIAIMAVVSVPYIVNYTRMYQSEVQATKVMDIMRETSQLALTRRRTYRMEIDVTDNQLKIIDENGSNPDLLVKSIPLESPGTLRLDAAPQSINRPDPPNYPLAVFAVDGTGHLASGQPVIGHRVWAIRFKSDGSVVNNGNTPVSATLFIYPVTSPSSDVPTDRKQVRVVTIYGGSGAVRYWKFNGTSFAAS